MAQRLIANTRLQLTSTLHIILYVYTKINFIVQRLHIHKFSTCYNMANDQWTHTKPGQLAHTPHRFDRFSIGLFFIYLFTFSFKILSKTQSADSGRKKILFDAKVFDRSLCSIGLRSNLLFFICTVSEWY